MKKYMILVLTFGLILLSVAPALGQDEIELRVSWWGSQNRHDRTIAAIELYEAANPNINITFEFAGWDDYWTKMTTQAAGRNLPDLMQQDYARLEEWVSRGLIAPLDPFIEDGTLDLSNVADNALAGGRIDDELYGLNLGTNSQTFILDVDAFERAGIELPPRDWTWQQFEETVTQLHDELGIWGIGAGLENEQMWKSLYLGHGEWSYADDGTGLGYTDDQIFVDYLNMLLRLQEAGIMPNREEVLARFDGQSVEADPIVTGESAIATMHSNQVIAVWTAAGEDRNFVLYHLPRPEGGQPENYLKPSMFWSITSQARHPEEAAKFMDWFTNSVEVNEILLAERGVPVSSVVREALVPLLSPAQSEMFEYISLVEGDNSPIRPPDPVGHANLISNVYIPQVIDPVLFGMMSPEEGVALLRDEATNILGN